MDENKRIMTLLGVEISSEFNSLNCIDTTSEEHSRAVDDLAKLCRLAIDMEKVEEEYREKRERREMEANQFEKELEIRKDELRFKRTQLDEQEKEYENDSKFREQENQLKQQQFDQQVKEHEDNAEYQKREEQLKRDQLKDQTIDRYVKLGAEIAGIVLPLMFYAVWMKRGFEFEKTGTFTSPTFRTLFSRFRPTKV